MGSFLQELRAYLREPYVWRDVNMTPYSATFLEALREETDDGAIGRKVDMALRDGRLRNRYHAFLSTLATMSVPVESYAERLGHWVARRMAAPARARADEDPIVEKLFLAAEQQVDSQMLKHESPVAEYAERLGLVNGSPPRRSRAGEVPLQLGDPDATLFLLRLELVRSAPAHDWGISREQCRFLVERRGEEDPTQWPDPPPDWTGYVLPRTLRERLSGLGVIDWTFCGDWEDADPTGYEVTEEGLRLVREVIADPPGPLCALADHLAGVETRSYVSRALGRALSSGPDYAETARMVAHQVRNALVPLQDTCDRLLAAVRANAPSVPVADHERRLRSAIASLHGFVDEYLRAAKLGEPTIEPVEVSDLLTELRTLAQGRGIGIELGDSLPEQELRARRTDLLQALMALVDNAHYATRSQPAPLVLVSAVAANGRLAIDVDDNGPGIPPDQMDRARRRGFTTKPGGTGLGLSLAQRVASDLGGQLLLDVSPLGGLRATMSLPLEDGNE